RSVRPSPDASRVPRGARRVVDLSGHEEGSPLPPAVPRTAERADDAPRGECDSDAAPRGDGVGDRQRPSVPARRDAPERRGPRRVRLNRSPGDPGTAGVGPSVASEKIRTEALSAKVLTRGTLVDDVVSARCLNVQAQGDVESLRDRENADRPG